MAVTIKEKDLLFVVVNLIGMISVISYLITDFIFYLCEDIFSSMMCINGADAFHMALVLIHAFLALLSGIVIIIVALVDLWWIIRFYNERNKGWL